MNNKLPHLFAILFFISISLNSFCQKQKNHYSDKDSPIYPPRELTGDRLKDYILNFFNDTADLNFIFHNAGIKDRYEMDDLFPRVSLIIDSFKGKQFQTYIPFSTANYKKAESIYREIMILSKQMRNRDVTENFKKIKKQIDLLPASKERVWLKLFYANYNITNTDFFQQVVEYAYDAGRITTKINDRCEEAEAHCYVGDFCAYYNEQHIALEAYFSALEVLDSPASVKNKDNRYKYDSVLGVIYRNIGVLYQKVGLVESFEKCLQYFELSKSAFDSAQQGMLSFEMKMKTLYAKTILYYNILSYDTSSVIKEKRLDILYELFFYYNNYVNKNHTLSISDSDVSIKNDILQSLGEVFLYEKKPRFGQVFLFSSLINSARSSKFYKNRSGSLSYILSRIAYAYSLRGYEKLSKDYIDLSINFSASEDDRVSYYQSMLTKADIFGRFRQFDSALAYVHWIRQDTSISDKLFPIFYSDLMEDDYNALSRIFHLNNNDSANFYGNLALQYRIHRYSQFAGMLQNESRLLYSWLSRSAYKSINEQMQLKTLAERNEKIERTLKEKAEYIVKLSKEKAVEDSVSRINAEMYAAKIDSINQEIERENKKIKDQDEQIKSRSILLLISTIIVAFLAGILVWLIYRNRKRSKEKLKAISEKLKATAKELTLRSAIKSHNLSSNYSKLHSILRENRLDDAMRYCHGNSLYYRKFYQISNNEIVTLEEEIQSLELFVKVENIYKKLPIHIEYDIDAIDTTTTRFLFNVFPPLYENALKYAFVEHKDNYSFRIDLSVKDLDLICRVVDNGKGNANIKSCIREDSYLGMLRDRILNYYQLQDKIVLTDEYFEIESSIEIGTKIQIIIPYETI